MQVNHMLMWIKLTLKYSCKITILDKVVVWKFIGSVILTPIFHITVSREMAEWVKFSDSPWLLRPSKTGSISPIPLSTIWKETFHTGHPQNSANFWPPLLTRPQNLTFQRQKSKCAPALGHFYERGQVSTKMKCDHTSINLPV